MAEEQGSSVPRRQLGRALRELRTEARMTLDGAAGALRCSRQKVWRIEAGLGAVRGADVRAMCELYGATAELTGALVALAGVTRAKGWLHSYAGPVPAWLDLYAGLEAAAGRLREYGEVAVPALVRTPEYAAACATRPGLTGAERKRLAGARLRRQELLRRTWPAPPRIDVVLSEAALLRTVGGPATMAGQLRHLAEVGHLPHVSIRVVPLDARVHRGLLAGPFTLLDFPPGDRARPEPSVVYWELLTGALYLDRPEEIAVYERVWADLDAVALDEEESQRLIGKLADATHHG